MAEVCGATTRLERRPGRWAEWVCTREPHGDDLHEAREVLSQGRRGRVLRVWRG